jgi:hypothetical protein
VCDPCALPHFGYYQTCWSPWPYPRDFRHCPYPQASDALPPPAYPPYTPKQYGDPETGKKTDAQSGGTTDGKKKAADDSPEVLPLKPNQPEPLGPPDKLDKEPGKPEKELSLQSTNVILNEAKVKLVDRNPDQDGVAAPVPNQPGLLTPLVEPTRPEKETTQQRTNVTPHETKVRLVPQD